MFLYARAVLLLAVSKEFYGNRSFTRTGRAAMLMINECAVSCQACVSVSMRLVAVETCAGATWISLILFLANWKFNKVTTAVPEHQDRDGRLIRCPVFFAIIAELHCGSCIVPNAPVLAFHTFSSIFNI